MIFERFFVAYGVRIGLRVNSRALLDILEQDPVRLHLPFGWRAVEDHEADDPVSIRYELRAGSSTLGSPPYHVYAGTELIAEVHGLIDVGRSLAAHAELFVAEHAPDHLFVHAGVVGWHGRAIVMPGASFAGKTTLVQAWLEAGATYYSDEFAVLDRGGKGVHPFARPLAIRDGSTALTRRVRVAALGAETGTTPLPVGLVLVTSYRAGTRWRPRRLTAAPALLALMRHTVAARERPEHSMPDLEADGGRCHYADRPTRRGASLRVGCPSKACNAHVGDAAFCYRVEILVRRGEGMMHPRQSQTVHTETLGEEVAVYDWARQQVHAPQRDGRARVAAV